MISEKEIKEEADKRYPIGCGYIGIRNDIFIEGAMWALEQIKKGDKQ